ncbi:MAG: hypothetical protein IJ308_04225 [Clostridia bacterium]|nr:hypothetical protein [Clostridia bacterium]
MNRKERDRFKELKQKRKCFGETMTDEELVELVTLYLKNTNRNLNMALIFSGIGVVLLVFVLIMRIIY